MRCDLVTPIGSASLQEVLQVELERGSGEGELEVLEHDRVHDTEAADLLRLLVGELQEDGGCVAGEVRWVCSVIGQLRFTNSVGK
jgi:hypothetical protein